MYKILSKKISRSRGYEKIIAQYQNIDEVVHYVKEKALGVSSPYIFTHLNLSDGTIITQEIMGMMCSPEALRKILLA